MTTGRIPTVPEPVMIDAAVPEPMQVALTTRERQVLALLVSGETYWNIGRQLGISPHTVDTYMRRLRGKTGAANRTQLVVMALQGGYVS
ncbi:response regulator transcription factor [Kitasatospora sp. NPDC056138]|uniref:response regulator transcription factor n=1 Tax=Kitasatospora sp. NPDC056138 TaxID=3345724 RepID=UPI0035DE1DBE